MSSPRPSKRSVPNGDRAVEVAERTLASAGHDAPEVVGDPHRSRGTWVVTVESDGDRYNVHIEPRTGRTRVAKL